MRLFGFHPVREALRHKPQSVARVWVGRARRDPRTAEITALCQRHRVALEALPQEELTRLAGPAQGGQVHNGFIAELVLATPTEIESSGDPDLVVLVEDVQDPRNFGALLRVCEGAGVGRVLVRDRGSAPMTATVVKTSAGAAEVLEVERITNSSRTLADLKREGFWVYAVAAGGKSPWELDLRGKLVLCFGGEEKGLRSLTQKNCDGVIGLPMLGHVESLNLATAAAAVLYDAVRQRGAKARRPS